VDGGSPARGWFDLNGAVVKFTDRESLFLFHYPLGEYLRMSQGSFLGAETSSRLRFFEGMTAPGSGGAPLFNRDFRLVGLHEGRLSPSSTGDSDKVALRADAIARVLRARGRLPPPWTEPNAEQAT
jgi:hypothetical protein